MKASHVVAVPLMLWNPDLIDNLDEEEIAKALKMKIVLSPSKTKTLSGTASKGFFNKKYPMPSWHIWRHYPSLC